MMQFFDIPLFNLINHGMNNRFFDLLMPFISRIGGGEFLFVLGIFMLFSRKREIKMMGLILIAGLTISFYAVSILKILIARPRPFLSLPNVILLASEKSFSFPSNHAATSFMAVFLLSSHFKRYALFYLFATLVCISRIYMGVHYPTDVIAGALLGIAIGYCLTRIAKSLV